MARLKARFDGSTTVPFAKLLVCMRNESFFPLFFSFFLSSSFAYTVRGGEDRGRVIHDGFERMEKVVGG